MRRLFWVAVGATAGVYGVRKVQKTLHAYSPTGLAERAQGLTGTLQGFVADVRAAMAEREEDLRRALGLDEGSPLTTAEVVEITGHPASPRARPQRRGGSA